MPPNSEIEKLERRWKDNPKGTGFAPYAEALRKQGELEQAREVLRQGLENHPDHIPGNIVLGRCCLDLREDGPAETAFRHVLDLDVENVIALKALAEITERQGRLGETSEWLSRLVASDPNNDEAVAYLARIEATRAAAAAAASRPLTESGAHAVPPAPVEPEAVPTEVIEPVAAASPSPPVAEPFRPEPETAATTTPESAWGLASPAPAEAPSLAEPTAATDAPTVELERQPAEVDVVPGLLVSEIDAASAASVEVGIEGIEKEEGTFIPPSGAETVEQIEGLRGSGTFIAGIVTEVPAEPMVEAESGFPAPDQGVSLVEAGTGASEFQAPEAALELSADASAASEFQAPDAALELSAASSASEFQAPDASLELSAASTAGSEFQTPSASEELSTAWSGGTEEAPPAILGMGAELGGPARAAEAVVPPEEPPADIIPVTAEPAVVEAEPAVAEPTAAALPMEEPPTAAAAPSAPAGELRIIFPEEAEQPEPPKIRRISQEVPAIVLPAATEPVVREPEPVMTESMAELYFRQGHHADALRVYRALAAQQPGERRFQERIREIESAQAPRPRRAGVAAVETGGESVESFFRSLASARPGLMGLAAAAAEQGRPAGKGAPTRPASDPLSLSAIFGEEPARTQAPSPPEPPAPPAADAFSFDQFFGKPGSPASRPPSATGRPSDDDLDQFQNWLKGLKR